MNQTRTLPSTERRLSRGTWGQRMGTWLLAVLLAIAIAAIVMMSRLTGSHAVVVNVVSPAYEDIERSVSSTGKVMPVEDFQAHAAFSGTVEKIYVTLGEKVRPGEMLIRMRDPFAASRVASATAALRAAELSRRNVMEGGSQEDRINMTSDRKRADADDAVAAKGLAVLKELERTGGASAAEVNAATLRLQAADAYLATMTDRVTNRYSDQERQTWKARVDEATASLTAERMNLANANITSPIAGVVYLTPVSQYDFVPSGADLMHVADLTRLQVRADFDEPDIGKLRVGQRARITWDGRPNQSWSGHLDKAPLATIIAGSRNVGECMIRIDDPDGELLPNTNVGVTIPVDQRRNALTIPREALHTAGAENFVFRISKGVLSRVPVDVGIVNLSRVEIVHGLSPNDRIALHALDNSELVNNLVVTELP